MKLKVIYVYVVVVFDSFKNAKVSQESYPSLQAAQEFCRKRGDAPEQLSEYYFKSKIFSYQIFCTTLVLKLPESEVKYK